MIDNNSQDGSRDYFAQKEYKNIKFIKSEINLGFGKANNLGIKKAKGEYIFLLNSDTLLLNNTVKILYDFMEKNLNVGICGANLYDEKKIETHSFGRLPKWSMDIDEVLKKMIFKITKKRNDFNYSNKPKEVGYITGADMFIRKKCLKKSGYFDKDFFMYFEETELTHRIRNLGYKVFSVPAAKIIHLEGKSFDFKEIRFRMMVESKYKYLEKVYGKKYKKYNYILSQLKYLVFPNFENRIKIRINKKEYKKSNN